jgi:hypothetical protein
LPWATTVPASETAIIPSSSFDFIKNSPKELMTKRGSARLTHHNPVLIQTHNLFYKKVRRLGAFNSINRLANPKPKHRHR